MTWITDIADRIERERDPSYVVKGGISPSGRVHVGHLNEFLIPYHVAEELRSRGYEVTQYMTIDDLDPNVTDVDRVQGVQEVNFVISELDIDVEVWKASEAYDGEHANNVDIAQQDSSLIESIVGDYQDTDAFTVFKGDKLPWRVEWAAQWNTLGVDFEPYGKDHAEGSFESSARIADTVFNIDPPVDLVYEWFNVDGEPMSSSKDNVIGALHFLDCVRAPDAIELFTWNPRKQRDLSMENIPSMLESANLDGPSYEECAQYWLGSEEVSRTLFEYQDIDDAFFDRVRVAGAWAQAYGDDWTLESGIIGGTDIEEVDDLINYAMENPDPDMIQEYAYECAEAYGDVGEFFEHLYTETVGQTDGPPAGELLAAIYQ